MEKEKLFRSRSESFPSEKAAGEWIWQEHTFPLFPSPSHPFWRSNFKGLLSNTWRILCWFSTPAWKLCRFYLSLTELKAVPCFLLSELRWNIILKVNQTWVAFSRRQMNGGVFRMWIIQLDQWKPLTDLNGPQTRKSSESCWESFCYFQWLTQCGDALQNRI